MIEIFWIIALFVFSVLIKIGGPTFRLFNAWLDHSDFKRLVVQSWNDGLIQGNKGYILKEKLKNLKSKLRTWNREVFGSMDLHIDGLVSDLNAIDKTLSEGGWFRGGCET